MPRAEAKVLFYNGECYSYPFFSPQFCLSQKFNRTSFIILFFRLRDFGFPKVQKECSSFSSRFWLSKFLKLVWDERKKNLLKVKASFSYTF